MHETVFSDFVQNIKSRRDLLVMELEVKEITNFMYKKGGLTQSECKRITGIRSESEAANTLLDIILQKNSPEIYEQFCEAVKATADDPTYTLLTQGTLIFFLRDSLLMFFAPLLYIVQLSKLRRYS